MKSREQVEHEKLSQELIEEAHSLLERIRLALNCYERLEYTQKLDLLVKEIIRLTTEKLETGK
jgi:hypothetical protein